ncbi:MAG: DUF541 domain-containing protein [Acidobacteria bacterium]|nr:DUF541 domain-containing protein [Acidobacteriota bacterium]
MRTLIFALVVASSASSQVRMRTVRANGDAVLSVPPDLARVSVGIVTNGTSAQQAAESNATISNAVIDQLKQAPGVNGAVRTTSYSLNPVYSSPRDGSLPQVIGYSASNTLEVTTLDLAQAGRIIDTAFSAGANRVNGLSFGLRDPNPFQIEALKRAAGRAREQAQAIVAGLGLNLGQIVALDEGVVTAPSRGIVASPVDASTRIEAGLLEVRATVTLEAEIVQ